MAYLLLYEIKKDIVSEKCKKKTEKLIKDSPGLLYSAGDI